MISLTLPGVSITYQGEEIGMVNNFDISFEETVDPQGLSCGAENYNDEYCSRDPERTPMQWSADPNAGFTSGITTWLPVNENYLTVNVDAQTGEAGSHLEIFRRTLSVRSKISHSGDMVTYSQADVLAFGSSGSDVLFVTAVNFGTTETTVDLSGHFHELIEEGLVIVAGAGGNNPEE
jgi:alpha-glucosidase